MLCGRCEGSASELGPNPRSLPPQALSGWGRLGSILCSRCGAVLSAEDHAERLLAKLAQLAQFGLAGESRPLLEASRLETSRKD